MRQVGSLSDEKGARLFTDFLVAQGIAAHAEQDDGQWAIWVRDEDHLDTAAETFRDFQADPSDQRFRSAPSRAAEIRQEEADRRRRARKNMIEMRDHWSRGAARKTPVVFILIGLSVLVAIITNFGKPIEPLMNWLTICRLIPEAEGYFQQVKNGELWRTITPIFIHFDLIHLVFNMYMLFYLGAQIEARRGSIRLGLLVLIIAVSSNVAQASLSQYFPSRIFGQGPLFGGMSGVDYGLFGYIWMKTVFDPGSGLFVSRGTVVALLAWFFLCLVLSMHIANGAHGAGLAVGMAIGYYPELLRSINRRE